MVVGEKRRLWIPANLAYGDAAGNGRPAGMLVFDVELLAITSTPRAPEDVAAPPKNAKRTKSGLAYRVLKKGTGKRHPKADSTVEAHFTGWTTDGKMFDSSVGRFEPPRVHRQRRHRRLDGRTSVDGRRATSFASGFRESSLTTRSPVPDLPKGMLVFDIELLSIR